MDAEGWEPPLQLCIELGLIASLQGFEGPLKAEATEGDDY